MLEIYNFYLCEESDINQHPPMIYSEQFHSQINSSDFINTTPPPLPYNTLSSDTIDSPTPTQ